RWAVAQAHDLDTIEIFSNRGSVRFIGLTHGELILNHSVTIETAPDSQVIISGQNLSRIFEIGREAYVNLDNLILVGGNAKAHPFTNSSLDGDGGGILNEGHLVLDQCWVASNGAIGRGGHNYAVKKGGGIYNQQGDLHVYESKVSANFALLAGGGIYNDGGLLAIGEDTSMDANSTKGDGGAIATFDTNDVSLTLCDMEQNTAAVG